MKVRFIINPAAGRKNGTSRVTESVKRVLSTAEGIFEIRVAKGRGDAGRLAADAVTRGYEAVYACGGDGTINEVASELIGTPAALGVVPSGSGNGFALSLGIPMDADGAVGLLKDFSVREIDAGIVADRYFFSTAGCGFDAHVSRKYHDSAIAGRVRGMFPYYVISLLEYLKYSPSSVIIKTGTYQTRAAPFLLTAANMPRYGGGAVIAPNARPDDGLLDLCIVTKTGFFNTMSLARKLMSGGIGAFNNFKSVQADRIEILGRDTFEVHADGEPFLWHGDLLIGIAPKKLKVIAP